MSHKGNRPEAVAVFRHRNPDFDGIHIFSFQPISERKVLALVMSDPMP
jgi:hypothetical protein